MLKKQEFIEYLSNLVTKNKLQKMDEALRHRTKFVTVLLEELYQPLNASAITRTCDCFGVQDLHVVENKNKFDDKSSISRGAFKWVDINKYSSLDESLDLLRKNDYKIFVTSPHAKKTLSDISFDHKVVLAFGTEKLGASDELLSAADECVSIPMFGFTESFNVSVSAALCLYDIILRLQKSDVNWQLSEQEKIDVKMNWLKKIIKKSEEHERIFFDK